MRLLSQFLNTIILAIIALSGIVLFTLFAPVSIPKNGAVIYVRPGISKENLVAELSQNNYVHSSLVFGLYVHFRGAAPRSGEFLIPSGSTPYAIWKQITSGTGHYYRAFTIIPGWNFKQVREALNNETMLKHLIAATDSNEGIMSALGDAAHSPEGMFLPETYYFLRGDADLAILKRAHNSMAAKLNEAWQGRAAGLPYQTPYQALIAASLIEKEAYLPQEQPKIGGVLINRLRKNMLLQFDPTVIYGMGDRYQGKIYKQDLLTDTPYNTYVHTGLPPTPIAMPGSTAIAAALHPEVHNFLYFVAKGDGSHEFTANLQDHHIAVQKAADLRAKQAANVPAAPTAVTGGDHVAR